jgi:large subunit ribosomal protein L4
MAVAKEKKTTVKKVVKKTVVKKPVVKKVVTKKPAAKVVKKVESKVGVELNPLVWNVKMNEDLVTQVLFVQSSNARQGNAHTKTRADVRGGGRKPWKQKGTGRARAGSNRSPIWRGGGVTFGPSNTNWSRKINRQMVKKAICMLLSERLGAGNVEFVNIEQKSLKELRNVVQGQIGKVRGLVISDSTDVKNALSNVEKLDYSTSSSFSALHVIKAKRILIDNEVVKMIELRLTNGK